MTEGKFSVGDPVWSKMKGYCAWPSRIAHPSESNLKNSNSEKLKTPKVHYLVYFFGSNNFAWMPEDTIKPYEEFKDKLKNGSKNTQFKQGLLQIEEYIARGGKATLANLDDVAITKNSTNNDGAQSPSAGDDSPASVDLPSIDEEIAAVNNKRVASGSSGAAASKKTKNSHDSHPDSSSLTSPAPASVQRDYSRTPFKSRKSAAASAKNEDHASELTSPTKRAKTTATSSHDDDYSIGNLSSPTISTTISKPPSSKPGARNVLLRASQYSDTLAIESPQINMSYVTAKSKTIRASSLKFGFIGLGFIGQRLLKNLLSSGHQVYIYNRTTTKCKEFVEAGATAVTTPGDVVHEADIVFSCLSDPKASKEVVFGSFGVLGEIKNSKGFVEMSNIDSETSNDISEAIIARSGRYLEAPMVANGKFAAEDGEAIFVAAGDRSLYEDCSSCFQAMGKQSFFLSHSVGHASKMNLVVSMLYGNIVGAISECLALVDRMELQNQEFKDILKLSVMNSQLTDSTIERIIKGDNSVIMPLGHLQKDLRLALSLSEEYHQTCPITAATNEVFKNANRFGYGDSDVSAIYGRNRY